MAGKADLSIYQGDDYAAMVTVRAQDGTPADITGYTALAQIRRGVADANPVVVVALTTAVSSPYVILSLVNAQTETLQGQYLWDLQLTSPTGTISTVLAGRVNVTQEVTR